MQRRKIVGICLSVCLLILFVMWTVIVDSIDVASVGPNNSVVGLSSLNESFFKFTGVNMSLYIVTDWLGLVPISVMIGFALLGLKQWIVRKRITKVDRNIVVLGMFYLTVFAVYMGFEYLIINYRPVLINGVLEASYPSSTTMLTLCVMPTAIMQFKLRIKNLTFKRVVIVVSTLFTAFMVIGRVVAGVHWLSDIIGGILISASLVLAYVVAK